MSAWFAAIDASTPDSTVAWMLVDQPDTLVCVPAEKRMRHNTEWIATLDKNGLSPKDLVGIAINVGPGSFTGLRGVCAIAQALSLANPALHLWRVPRPDVLRAAALKQPSQQAMLCILAYKGEYAWTQMWAADGSVILEPADRHLDDILPYLEAQPGMIVGDIPPAWASCLPSQWQHMADIQGDAADVLALALAHRQTYQTQAAQMVPLYPREAEAVTLWRARHG